MWRASTKLLLTTLACWTVFLLADASADKSSLRPAGKATVEMRQLRMIWNFPDESPGDSKSCSHREVDQAFREVKVAVIRVPFSESLYARNLSSDAKPVQLHHLSSKQRREVLDGATRLVCGRHLIESVLPEVPEQHANRACIECESPFERLRLLHTTESGDGRSDAALSATVSESELNNRAQDYVALLPLSLSLSQEVGGFSHGEKKLKCCKGNEASPRSSLPHLPDLSWDKCVLRFLPARQQLRAASSRHVIVDEKGHIFEGDVPLTEVAHPYSAPTSKVDEEMVRNSLIGTLDLQQSFLAVSLRSVGSPAHRLLDFGLEDRGGDPVSKSVGRRWLRPRDDPELMSLLQSNEDLGVGIDGIVQGIVGPVVGGVSAPMADGVVGSIIKPITSTISPAITTAISNMVGDNLNAPIINSVIDDAVPGVTETISDYLLEFMQVAIESSVPPAIMESVTTAVMQSLPDPATKVVSEGIEELVPKSVGNRLSHDLGLILSKTLSSSITSSLTDTLSHSPMEDYFCYYCEKNQEYCQYCKVAPTRLYYSQYYADYFSSYYSQYYVNYFSMPGQAEWVGQMYPEAQHGASSTEKGAASASGTGKEAE